jgi:ribosomal protein S18 acetylase RimI-like enzyme
MPPDLRPFQPSDYPAALALWQSTPGIGLGESDKREAIEAFLARNPGLSFVACEDGEILGTILCGHDGRRGLIHHLVVAPSHRRTGLGRRLLGSALGALGETGIIKCHLVVFKTNPDGLAFWRAMSATERTELALFSLATEHAG